MKKVLLTGISGFLGQHCATELLKNGYEVRGSVRELSKREAVIKGISRQIDPKGKLEFCELNLMSDRGWDEAMLGCDFLMHTASPFVLKVPKDENKLIKPAVEGTQRALKTAKKVGIKRIVLTSSIIAMLGNADASVHINPDSWSNIHTKNATAYLKSKTLAEKSAREFIGNQKEEKKLELVTINPGPIYGPTLTGNLAGESMDFFVKMITGNMPILPNAAVVISDVRDVATIHVKALEQVAAKGKRFIVSTEKPYSFEEIAKLVKQQGHKKVSTKVAPNRILKLMARFNSEVKGILPFIGNTIHADISDTKKIFNWEPMSFEKTILDTVRSVQNVLESR